MGVHLHGQTMRKVGTGQARSLQGTGNERKPLYGGMGMGIARAHCPMPMPMPMLMLMPIAFCQACYNPCRDTIYGVRPVGVFSLPFCGFMWDDNSVKGMAIHRWGRN
ncbi:MAG: hypothetical protein RR865_13865, partial [Clostridia bacterium]